MEDLIRKRNAIPLREFTHSRTRGLGIDPGVTSTAKTDGIPKRLCIGPFNSTECAILANIYVLGR